MSGRPCSVTVTILSRDIYYYKDFKILLIKIFCFGIVYILLVAFYNSCNVMLKYINPNQMINTKVFAYWLVDN